MSNETALDKFRDIPDQMVWRTPALEQIERFRLFAENLGFPWDVVGHHTSKSIALPVIRITCQGMAVYLRDNFHDVNICMVAEKPITIPTSALFDGILEPLSWDWYLEQVAKCRGYSWREWTDEQMDAPGLLCLTDDAPWYVIKKPEEKARWAKRMTDPEWFCRDWSSGKIVWEGEFGPGVTMWVQVHAFLQGIDTLVPSTATRPYTPGCCGFAMALYDLDQAARLIQKITTTQIVAAEKALEEWRRES